MAKKKGVRLSQQRNKLVKTPVQAKSRAEASKIAADSHPNAVTNALRALGSNTPQPMEKHVLTDDRSRS